MSESSFREALGSFATGVTVVTTSADSGPVGLTVNSFSSVSLNPPLVLWSLSKSANCLNAFTESTHFAVHIMACDQIGLSKQFSQSGSAKFSGVPFDVGVGNMPLLSGCSSRFQCKTAFTYEGGDHLIFVGEVIDYDTSDMPALLFYRGAFRNGRNILLESELAAAADTQKLDSSSKPGGFNKDFFPYLLARAHFQLNGPLKIEIESAGLDEDGYFILLLLSIADGRTIENLSHCLEHTNHIPTSEKIAQMHEQGFIEILHFEDGDYIYITNAGRDSTKRLLALSEHMEERLKDYLGLDETGLLKKILKKVIDRTDPGVPNLWERNDRERKSLPNLRIIS